MTNPLLDRKLIHYPGVVCFHDSPAEIEGVLVSVCRILLRERRAPRESREKCSKQDHAATHDRRQGIPVLRSTPWIRGRSACSTPESAA